MELVFAAVGVAIAICALIWQVFVGGKTLPELLRRTKALPAPAVEKPSGPPEPASLLPYAPERFVNRNAHREQLRALLASRENPPIFVVGEAGYGKTGLIAHVLKSIGGRQAYFSSDRSQLRFIFREVGRIAGRQDEFDQTYASELPSFEKLQWFFTTAAALERLVVVLDNFENVLAEDGEIADPELKEFVHMAATYRGPFALIAITHRMPSLPRGARFTRVDVDHGLDDADAVDFLRSSLKASDEQLRELARRVGGVPLALQSLIDFAGEKARRGRQITVAELVQDGSLLAEYEAYDGKRGLRALLKARLAALPPDVQLALACSAVLPEPFRSDQVAALVARVGSDSLTASGTAPAAVVGRVSKTLDDLVPRFLIEQGTGYSFRHPLYSRLIWDPALFGGQKTELHTKAAAHYESLAPEIKDLKTDAEADLQIERVRQLIFAERYDEAGVVLNKLQTGFLGKRGRYQQSLSVRDLLAERASSATLPTRRSDQIVDRLSRRQQAYHFYHLAVPLTRLGSPLEAARCVQRSLHLWQELSRDPEHAADAARNIPRCHNQLGIALFNLDRYDLALRAYRDAFESAQERDKSAGHTHIGNMAETFLKLGSLEESANARRSAVALFETKPVAEQGLAMRAYYSGLHAAECVFAGRYDEALTVIEPAIENAKADLRPRKLAVRFRVQAKAYLLQGAADKALQAAEASRDYAETVGATRDRYSTAVLLGRLHHGAGRLSEARAEYERALTISDLAVKSAPDAEERAATDLLSYAARVLYGVVLGGDEGSRSISEGLWRAEELLKLTPRHQEAAYTRAFAKAALRHEDRVAAYAAAADITSARGIVDEAILALKLLPARIAKECEGLLSARRAA